MSRCTIIEAQLALTNYGKKISRNTMTQSVEIDGKAVTDQNITNMRSWLSAQSLEASKDTLEVALNTQKVWPEIHPFKALLDKHKKAKPKGIIREYAKRIKTTFGLEEGPEFDPEAWPRFFEKWYVAMIKGAYEDHRPNDLFIVIYGSQGLGKTWFIKNILPSYLLKYVSKHALKGDLNKDRELLLKLTSSLILYEDEMGYMNTESVDSLKAIMSEETIRLRPLYSNRLTDKKRLGSFIGSSNKAEHLRDSENRRLLIIGLNPELEAPISYVQPKNGGYLQDKEEIKRAELMIVEAVNLMNEGFESELTKKEVQFINSQMLDNHVISKEDSFVAEHINADTGLGSRKVIGKSLIFRVLRLYFGTVANQPVEDAMTKAGFKYSVHHIIGGKKKGYAINESSIFFNLDGNHF